MDQFSTPGSSDGSETVHVDSRGHAEEVEPTPGTMMSRYVVLEQVGRGGMGRVIRAYDPKLQREVAVKELRGGALDEEAAARLVAEARAMAKLSHPNVVAIYDVEELGPGAVILVMEFVPGETLREWSRAKDHAWTAIVERFLEAGRGLAAAHDAGLLHRDFKPENVLVPNGGAAKVTDFGIAKVSGAPSASDSIDGEASDEGLTRAGTIMGTPRYMAPEQHAGAALTAAADQFSFCVALWEALCGAPPYAGKSMGRAKSGGPPPWPERAVPRPISDAILRGLSPDPGDRWPTMAALLQALRWDPSGRRSRWVLAGGLVALVAAGVAVQGRTDDDAERCTGARAKLDGIWGEAHRANVEAAFASVDRPFATEAWARTAGALDAYATDWAAMHTESCEATTLRGEQSPLMMDLRMGCLHRAAVDLDAAVQVLAVADADVVRRAHEITAGLPPLAPCADAEALTADVAPPPENEADAVEDARAALARSRTLNQAGRYQDAEAAVEHARASLAGTEYGPVRTEVALAEGEVFDRLGRYDASVVALGDALRLGAHWEQREEMRDAAVKLMLVLGDRQRKTDEALQFAPLAEGLSEDPLDQGGYRNNLATVLVGKGKYDEAAVEHRAALELLENVLGPDALEVAQARSNLAMALFYQGKYKEAEAEHRAVLDLRRAAFGPDHPDVGTSRGNRALALARLGKVDESEDELRAALSIWEAAVGPNHERTAMWRDNFAGALYMKGEYAEAEVEYKAALEGRLAALGPDHPDVAGSRSNIANVLYAQGKHVEAEAENRAVLALRKKTMGADHPRVGESHQNLAAALLGQGKHAEAEAEFRAGLAVLTKALGADHPNVAMSRYGLAIVLQAQEKYADAEPELRAIVASRAASLGEGHPDVAAARFSLAEVLHELGRDEDARKEAGEALEVYLEADDARNVTEIQDWLAKL